MRKALYMSLVLGLAVSILSHAQEKEKVTISGKITVKDTGKPPIGIITVIEKGVVDYYANQGESIGTNRHTFVEKDGSYTFTINKGGTIMIWDAGKRYKLKTLTKLDKSQTIDIVLNVIEKTPPITYTLHELKDFEKKTDIHNRIKISGRITFPDGKGMGNATISQPEVSSERIPLFAHVCSDINGEYSYSVLKGGRILIGASGYERQVFTATQDTVINVKMKKVNPFK